MNMNTPTPNPDRFEALMLDQLYGLIEPNDAAELEQYLATPAGAELKAKAEHWKKLLSHAAKAEFPEVQFAPPSSTSPLTPASNPVRPASPTPATSPTNKTKTPSQVWQRWAFAGVACFVLFGLGGASLLQVLNWKVAHDDFKQIELTKKAAEESYNQAREQLNKKIEQIEKENQLSNAEIEKISAEYEKALADLRETLQKKEFFVRLSGPARAQPGAPNEWLVETLDRNQVKVDLPKIEFIVKDNANNEVYRQTIEHQRGPTLLKLPPSLWKDIPSGTDLHLKVIATNDHGQTSTLAEKVSLSGPTYTTHLTTDKPMYRPGDLLRFRSLTLDRATFTPPEVDLNLQFRLVKPDGSVQHIESGNGRLFSGLTNLNDTTNKPLRGLGAGEYLLDESLPGGEYTLQVFQKHDNGSESLVGIRKFLLNKYNQEHFFKKLELDGKSYGAGDFVQARAQASRTQGGPLKGATAKATAILDGKVFWESGPLKLNNEGIVDVRFQLPAQVGQGNATLTVNFQDGENESITRPIPVVGTQLRVEFFPEGGELVQGIPSRVYFQTLLPNGKPADLKGSIVDEMGQTVVEKVATLTDAQLPGVNRGQGVFSLTPRAGQKYFLKLQTPVGIQTPTPQGFPLPEVKAEGVVLTTIKPIYQPKEPITLTVQPSAKKILHVGAYSRGRLIKHTRIVAEAGKATSVSLEGEDQVGGVVRVTVFEEAANNELLPKAERLVYRVPSAKLNLFVSPDRVRDDFGSYTPGAKVQLTLNAVNENNQSTPAVVMVAVVNQSNISMADNKTDRLLPTHFLLAGEVKDSSELEHADFLLTDHPMAAQAMDLLLGVQGWRRFVEQNPKRVKENVDVEKLLVANGQIGVPPASMYALEAQRIHSEFQPKLEDVLVRQAEAAEARREFYFKQQNELAEMIRQQRMALENTNRTYQTAAMNLANSETRLQRSGAWALPLLLLASMFIAFASFGIGINRKQGLRQPYLVTSLVSTGIAVLAALGLTLTWPSEHEGLNLNFARNGRDKVLVAEVPAEVALGGGDVDVAYALPADLAKELEIKKLLKENQLQELGQMNDGAPRLPFNPPFGGEGFGGGPPRKGVPPGLRFDGNDKQDRANGFNLNQGKVNELAEVLDKAKKFNKGERIDEAKGNLFKEAQQRDRVRAQLAQNPHRLGFAAGKPAVGRPNAGGIPAAVPGAAPAPPFVGGPAAPIAPLPPMFEQIQARPSDVGPMFVREYAHQRAPELGEIRGDNTETVYWHPALVIPNEGHTTIQFQLSDEITRYQVLVAGHTTDGRLGAVTRIIEARKPYTIEPKLPVEISSGDILDIALNLNNDSDEARELRSELQAKGLRFLLNGTDTWSTTNKLKPEQKARAIVRVQPTIKEGQISLLGKASSLPLAEPEAIFRQIKVLPEGFPAAATFADLLENQAHGTIKISKDRVAGTLKARFEVYPTSMADVVKGLEGLLQEPHGCFEQTSTANYPNTMILDYLNSTNQAAPELSKRAKDLLTRGYGRLTGYECPYDGNKVRNGFEWFGKANSAHEALTAYGLLQFKDMAKVHEVDPNLIKRTQEFLMSRRDGKGGFLRNPVALDQFGGAPEHTTNAYIVWALVESDPENKEKLDLAKEIAALKEKALKADSPEGKDSYFVALVANTLLLRDDKDAEILLNRLIEKNLEYTDATKSSAKFTGAQTSITRSSGQSLEIETTSLVILGLLRSKEGKFMPIVKAATKWVGQQRGAFGGYGSTQSTVLALKALILYAKKTAHPAEAGRITLTVKNSKGEKTFTKDFTEKDIEVIAIDIENPEEVFPAGEEVNVEVTTTAKHPYPFSLNCTYTTLTPASAEKCPIRIETKLNAENAEEGAPVTFDVKVKNLEDKVQGMTVAIVSVPAGLQFDKSLKQLNELRDKGVYDFYELNGRDVVFYWRSLKEKQEVSFSLTTQATYAGEYRGAASRGYLYYMPEHKHWVEPMKVSIKATEAK